MKKVFTLLLAVVCVFTFATGCSKKKTTTTAATTQNLSNGSTTTTSYDTKVTINMAINYLKSAYISFAETNPYTGLDGKTLTNGDLLPVWSEIQKVFNINLVDAADKNANSTSAQYSNLKNESFAGIDILNGTVDQFAQDGTEGKILDLGYYINLANPSESLLPNLSKFLKDNPSIYSSIQATNGAVYFAPYFDGLNEIERMLIMNTTWIENVLDGTATGDTEKITTFGKYSATQGESVSTNIMVPTTDGLSTRTYAKSYTANVITTMNAKITTNGAAGVSGQEMLSILKAHLTSTYADAFDKGIYTKLSEIYTSASAGYDADELIALMRVIKANPKLASGEANKKSVTILAPRNGETTRQRDITRFMQIWGIRGVESRAEFIYFDDSGVLNDVRGEDDFIQGICYLNQLYQEGLIQENYATGYNNTAKNEWRMNLMKSNSIFMVYDYNATTTTYSVEYPASGQNPERDLTGFEACLPPANAWEDGVINTNSGSGYTKNYFCFTESMRSVKSDAWGVPLSALGTYDATTKTYQYQDKLIRLLAIIDYFYSEDGNTLMCYGPSAWIDGTFEYNGESIPKISDSALAEMKRDDLVSQGDMFMYYRSYVGATINIGYVRGLGVEYQALNEAGRTGINKINLAMNAGSFKAATTEADYLANPFYMLPPAVFTISSADSSQINQHNVIQSIFSDGKAHYLYIYYGFGNATNGTVSISDYKTDVTNEFNAYYLKFYRKSWQEICLLNEWID